MDKERNIPKAESFVLMEGTHVIHQISSYWSILSGQVYKYLDILQVIKLAGPYFKTVEKKWKHADIQREILLEENSLKWNTSHNNLKVYTDR